MRLQDHEVARLAAQAGARVVRARFGTRLEHHAKGAGDFATDVDLEAEDAIVAVLATERPDDRVVGEERGRRGAAAGSREWLVDPLCGTANYAAGTAGVAVNVALVDGGRTVVAAVADPIGDEIVWTDGAATYVGPGERATPTAATRLVDLNLDPPYPSAPALQVRDLLSNDGFGTAFRPRVLSTSLALAWVATGRRAAYVTDGAVEHSVHFAAGIAVCRGAGCVVTDLLGDPDLRAPGLVAAADGDTHALVLALLGSGVTPAR